MPIKYCIPVKASKNNGALRCTIPREIVLELEIQAGDRIVWKLFENKKLEVEFRSSKKPS